MKGASNPAMRAGSIGVDCRWTIRELFSEAGNGRKAPDEDQHLPGAQDGGGRFGLQVAIELCRTSFFPVLGIVLIGAGTAGEGTEKDVPRRTDHNTNVSLPNDQVARLRILDPAEMVGAAIQVGRIGIGIRETGAVIDVMHQVRAVSLTTPAEMGVEGSSDYRQAVVWSQGKRAEG